MADLPWPGHVADPVWKPVVLPDQEVVPAIPSIDELAEEGGVDAATLRFPIDT